MTITETTYSSEQVCQAAGVTYRMLDYWARTGLIYPSAQDCAGSGTRRRWTVEDVVRARRIKLASDLSSGGLQAALDRLDDIEGALAELASAEEMMKGTSHDGTRSSASRGAIRNLDGEGVSRRRHPSAGGRGRAGVRRVASVGGGQPSGGDAA